MSDKEVRREIRDLLLSQVAAFLDELMADWRPGDSGHVAIERPPTVAEAMDDLLGEMAALVGGVTGTVELGATITVRLIQPRPVTMDDVAQRLTLPRSPDIEVDRDPQRDMRWPHA